MTASTPGFDTLAYACRLEEAGVDEARAEARAEAVRGAIGEGVATRADGARIGDKMATGTARTRIETRSAALAELKVTMLPAMVAIAGVIVASVKPLPQATP